MDTTTNKQLSKSDEQPITSEQGWNLTRELGAVKYLECSALTQVIIYMYIKYYIMIKLNKEEL